MGDFTRLSGAAELFAHLLHKLLQFVFGHNFSVKQMNFALGVFYEPWIMRDHAYGRAFAVQFLQQLHHGLAVVGIEIARRFIGEENRWMSA